MPKKGKKEKIEKFFITLRDEVKHQLDQKVQGHDIHIPEEYVDRITDQVIEDIVENTVDKLTVMGIKMELECE